MKLKSSIHFSLSYLKKETKRNLRGYFIGVFTVTVVVGFVAVIYNTIGKSPLIFLKMAEITVGEQDIVLYPSSTSLINQTVVDLATQSMLLNFFSSQHVDNLIKNKTS